MSSLAVALAVVGSLVPHAGPVQMLGAVPMGIIAHRTRLRALLAGAVAGGSVAFLLGGSGPTWGVLGCAVIGAVVGEVKRRSGSWRAALTVALITGSFAALVGDLVLLGFAQYRTLTLDSIRSLIFGVTDLARHIPRLRSAAAVAEQWTAAAIRWWWLTVSAAVLIGFVAGVLLVWKVLGAVLERLAWLPIEKALPDEISASAVTGPLPIRLSGVGFAYDGASTDALSDIDLRIDPGEFVVITGRNGSGKSTLARLLAGHSPTRGVIERSGAVGLGRIGGTAWIGQRPESQILGVTVADDVVWGLPSSAEVDVPALLAAVGLGRHADRSTSTLSGGELQRLAVAAALARRPALLISDESSAMVDTDGRRALMQLLHTLPAQGTAVVHVTHDLTEIADTDRVVRLEHGRLMPTAELLTSTAARRTAGPAPVVQGSGEPLVRVQGVEHIYAAGTPWQHRALRGVDFEVPAGDGLLIVGGNGSGKSTLGWILAGLTIPTAGSVRIGGHAPDPRRGSALLAFQHARLQVQGPDVRSELGSGRDRDAVAQILSTVGLDPDLADRPVDRLSGGQLRRVALAGLISRQPRLLVLDEPLAGLDMPSRLELLELLELLARARAELGLTLIVISHDNLDMYRACSRGLQLIGGRVREMNEMADAR